MPKGMEEEDRVNPKPRVRGNRLKPLVIAQLGRRAQECTLSPTGARNKGCFAAGPEGLREHTIHPKSIGLDPLFSQRREIVKKCRIGCSAT